MMVLRLALLVAKDPRDMTAIFPKRIVASELRDGPSVKFCAILLADKSKC